MVLHMALAAHDAPSPRDNVRRSIRILMADRRMNQTKLGKAAGLSQSKLSRRLSGEPFDEVELEAVAQALGVPVAALYDPMSILATTGYRSHSASRKKSELTLMEGGGRGRRTAASPILLAH